MVWTASWIKPENGLGDICPVFKKEFNISGSVASAVLYITAIGVYESTLNGTRISNYILAPGWTVYEKRHQFQEYDITQMISETNTLCVTVANGWYRLRLADWMNNTKKDPSLPTGLIAQIEIEYVNGTHETIVTDQSWGTASGPLQFCDIYDGEIYNAMIVPDNFTDAQEIDGMGTDNLIRQEGEIITEHEHIKPLNYIVTPKGERVIDFGQNMTGYVEFTVNAKAGDKVSYSHAEVLDADGNFYTENYRKAKAKVEYICSDGVQVHKPSLTFMGFRYIRLDEFPIDIHLDDFTAIVVHSQMERTGYLQCSNKLLNKLFENIIWGQKGNFLDIPTDCPQRDERLGWTGDAQVFVRTASYNFDVKKFFVKWLRDLSADQLEDGLIPHVIPNILQKSESSAAWGDAAVICPWQIYLTYGDKTVLENQFESMKLWIKYITTHTKDRYLWTGGNHFGDWLGIDAPFGSYTGASNMDFIASAYYAYSTEIVIKTGKVLGVDTVEYEKLYENIVKEFRKTFTEYKTQTEHAVALYFGLAEDKNSVADNLAKMVINNANKLTTGFVGTPYLLHALSENGYANVAYSLLLQEDYPSWLFSVRMGATTIWEHWDGIKEDGSFWSKDMNSYNHYAYGAVADWVYGVAAGIKTVESSPGFERIIIAPIPDKRLEWLGASIKTKFGVVSSKWYYADDKVRYEITTPSSATIILGNKTYEVEKGTYIF